MMEGIEAWEEDVKIVELQGDTYRIPENVKIVALEILFTKFPTIYEAIERSMTQEEKRSPNTKFNALLTNLKAHAARKRLQAQYKRGKGDLLNVDEVPDEMKQEIEMTTVWTQEGYPIEVAVDAIGKGKASGKGGKGFKGKGQENMQCYNCHEFGHSAAQCPNAVKCNNCGKKGAQSRRLLVE